MTLSNKRKAIIEEFKKVRTDAISEMFDHENELGIYPTSKFFNTLDNYLTQVLNDYTQSIIEMIRKMPITSPHDPNPIIDQVIERLTNDTK